MNRYRLINKVQIDRQKLNNLYCSEKKGITTAGDNTNDEVKENIGECLSLMHTKTI